MRVAVIGAGVMGLSTAYFLAKSGVEVKVFEQKYLTYGASGRNSGGITAMLDREELIPFAMRSLEMYENLPSELEFNFLFRMDGYIKVADRDEDVERLEKSLNLQRKLGVDAEIIEPQEIRDLIPDFNSSAVTFAVFSKNSGVVFPWPVVWGLAKGCRELGVEIKTHTKVHDITIGEGIRGVKAGDEFFEADVIVNSAGAWSNEMSRIAGIELGNKIMKEEICVTESIKPYLDPYLLDVSHGLYISQTSRGEIVGGITGREVEKIETKSSMDFLVKYARRVTQLIPKLKGLSILRQWSGVYDEGKDGLPVVGFSKDESFVQANGLGHWGMTIGLSLGKELAKLIIKGENPKLKPFSPERF